jgi:hypothetical protein
MPNLTNQKITIPIGTGVSLPLIVPIIILCLICSCCLFTFATISVPLREIGVLPTYTPLPTQTAASRQTFTPIIIPTYTLTLPPTNTLIPTPTQLATPASKTTSPTKVTPTSTKSPTTRAPIPTATVKPVTKCDPSYPDVCIPPPPPDLNCSNIPYKRFRVLPPDPHGFDRDGNGIGCEN